MAKVTATVFKAQLATAAGALTTAFQDDTVTEIAQEFKPNHHALRRLAKLFILNKSTGVFTSNDAYVDAVYAGNTPNQGRLTDGQGVPTPVALSTATVENAAPTDIVLTFDSQITQVQQITLGGNSDPAKAIAGISIAGAVVTITVDTAYVALATITVSGTFLGTRGEVILTDQAVTNNVT